MKFSFKLWNDENIWSCVALKKFIILWNDYQSMKLTNSIICWYDSVVLSVMGKMKIIQLTNNSFEELKKNDVQYSKKVTHTSFFIRIYSICDAVIFPFISQLFLEVKELASPFHFLWLFGITYNLYLCQLCVVNNLTFLTLNSFPTPESRKFLFIFILV